MTGKTTNKFSPEVRARAVRMVLYHASEPPSRWAAVTSRSEMRALNLFTTGVFSGKHMRP